MSAPKIGDIIEVPTAQGIAYAQYTHQHRQFGGVIRVFDTIHQERPNEFSKLVHSAVRFSTLFPVTAAINRGIFNVVGHEEVAPGNKPFPLFRAGNADPKTRKVAVWWLWDGEKEWKVGSLSSDQRRLPIRSTWNDTMLIKRIEEGWRPESDARI